MKKLLVLWDPGNPLTPVAPVVGALSQDPGLELKTLTFGEIGHPTLPNRRYRLKDSRPLEKPDGILWIEGGPLPGDLGAFDCPKAAWLINTHLEPGLNSDFGNAFDRVFSASLKDTADEGARWLPLAAAEGEPVTPPGGVSLLIGDPMPPSHAAFERALLGAVEKEAVSEVPIVFALGAGGRFHPMLFEALRSGAAVVAGPGSDLRGVAHVGDHLEVAPSMAGLPEFLSALTGDRKRLSRLANRGPAIVSHLHGTDLRAQEIRHGLWPRARILSGTQHRPRVSLLVACYRYLQRFRICLESLARQDMPPGAIEIIVADPGCPDGLARHLEEFADQHPALRIVHLPIDGRYHRNRGFGINRAFDVSQGRVVIGIDGDIVFPPALVGFLERRVLESPHRVFGVRRSFVSREDTEQILRGELDPFTQLERLSKSEGDGEENAHVGVLGYCQAVSRSAFARARYPEEFDTVNQSDIVFLERLDPEAGVRPEFLGDQTVLHLWHPRNWNGTMKSL